eukprot:6172236-Pleurochrysis_carterae.AAC.6
MAFVLRGFQYLLSTIRASVYCFVHMIDVASLNILLCESSLIPLLPLTQLLRTHLSASGLQCLEITLPFPHALLRAVSYLA